MVCLTCDLIVLLETINVLLSFSFNWAVHGTGWEVGRHSMVWVGGAEECKLSLGLTKGDFRREPVFILIFLPVCIVSQLRLVVSAVPPLPNFCITSREVSFLLVLHIALLLG